MTAPALDDLIARALPGIVGNPCIPVWPQPKQAAFLRCNQREVLYGGAAFGGKTFAMLMAALQYAHVPGYSAIIFRRSYPELVRAEGLVPLTRRWLTGKGPVWNEQRKIWTWPNEATLALGSIDSRKHLERWAAGPSYQFIGYEELTTFPEDFYRTMFSRLRRPKVGPLSRVPIRMRSTTNPGGIGHAWVKARWDLPRGGRKGRIFVPALLTDNKAGDAVEYVESLRELDPVTLARMLEGNWDVVEGGTFIDRGWFGQPEHPNAAPARDELRLVRAWDCAGSTSSKAKYTAGVLMGLHLATGIFWVLDVQRFRARPAERDERILSTARDVDGVEVAIVIEQEPADAGIKQADDQVRMLAGFDVTCEPATKGKLVRATPFARQARGHNVRLVDGPWTADFLDEMMAAGEDAVYMDQLDAAALAFNHLADVGQPSATVLGEPKEPRVRLGQWSAPDPRRRRGAFRR